jgi:hypothetical protein
MKVIVDFKFSLCEHPRNFYWRIYRYLNVIKIPDLGYCKKMFMTTRNFPYQFRIASMLFDKLLIPEVFNEVFMNLLCCVAKLNNIFFAYNKTDLIFCVKVYHLNISSMQSWNKNGLIIIGRNCRKTMNSLW